MSAPRHRRLILASASPRRELLLRNAGFEPIVVCPPVDDAKLVPGRVSPTCWVAALAYLKARAVGALHDVVIDLRSESPTFCKWIAAELNAEKNTEMFVPQGCAHGFQTLVDNTEVSYLMSERYVPESASGVRYDDPAFGVEWPLAISFVADRDRSWPEFRQ